MILFITRKYPPSIGGMQQMAYNLSRELSARTEVRVIAWGGSQVGLPYFVPAALLRSCLARFGRQRPRLVHIADCLLAPLAVTLKTLLRVPATATGHGLDVTWDNPFYQRGMKLCLPRLDRILCVSNVTRQECLRRGVAADRARVIPTGVVPIDLALSRVDARQRLQQRWPGVGEANRLLLTLGRLVERKGVDRLIADVLPLVEQQMPGTHYLVVGEGPWRGAIVAAAQRAGLADRVHVTGLVDQATRGLAYRAADLFVMPNRPVRGDLEGFGVVALEAAAAGLWVVASRVEGVVEAVSDGVNGFLLEPDRPAEWAATIVRLLRDDATRVRLGEAGRLFVLREFSWQQIGARYAQEFAALGALP